MKIQTISLNQSLLLLGKELQEHAKHGKPPGSIKLDWWPALSEKLGWLRAGTLTIFAGRPGDCKTAFFLSASYHAATKQNQRVLYITLEELVEDVASRMMKAFLPYYQDDQVDNGNLPVLLDATKKLADKNLPVDIVAVDQITPDEIDELLKQYPPDQMPLTMIDYLTLMSASSASGAYHQDLNGIIRDLKKIMKRYKVVGMLAAQLKRDIDSRKGMEYFMSDIQGTSGAEQHTDRVVFLRRNQPGDEFAPITGSGEYVTFIVLKNRRGGITVDPSEYIRLAFAKSQVFFPEGDAKIKTVNLDDWEDITPDSPAHYGV